MPQHQIETFAQNSFVDKRRATAGSAAVSSDGVTTPANFDSIADMDTRLTAISATTYSQANLDSMTQNDKLYALRVNDENGSI